MSVGTPTTLANVLGGWGFDLLIITGDALLDAAPAVRSLYQRAKVKKGIE
ncbi:MAG: hypothetical protein GY798_22480 [Hyphomicrobiales bacterium]|nr:hypothetical protein [Hyphomicrobiales bacterium]